MLGHFISLKNRLASAALKQSLWAFVQVPLFVDSERGSQDLVAAPVGTGLFLVKAGRRMRGLERFKIHLYVAFCLAAFDPCLVHHLLSKLVEVAEAGSLVRALRVDALCTIGLAVAAEVLLARFAGASFGQKRIALEAQQIRVEARGLKACKTLDESVDVFGADLEGLSEGRQILALLVGSLSVAVHLV
uniref:Uncharacterized protein n=1 Tax=Strombidium inclinatum TaxID=197538 RepID=A0A7S3IUB7_9SPIT